METSFTSSFNVEQPKVAILLGTYQGQKYLAQQLDSFAAQTHQNWEVWASDDGSQDSTHNILEQYEKQWPLGRMSIHNGPKEGFAANFLSLTCKASIKADYYAYSDQDDIWEGDKLARAVQWLQTVPAHIPALYCGRTQLVDKHNRGIGFSPLFTKSPSFANALMQNIGVHPDVVKLGLVSMLTDLSSEMIFSVFAIFFTSVAGASTALLGLIEGCADLSASSLNYLSGWLSDRTGKRKVFALLGYGFSTLAKVILLVSSSVVGLGIFRVVERLGKSFRGPPRDAWLSSVAGKTNRGYSFGVHKALDKTGAILGPLIAYGLLRWLGDGASTFKMLFWIALIPAVLSIIVLSRIQDQPEPIHQRENMLETWNILSPQFKRYLITSGIFSLAYFSFGFLLLHAHDAGFTTQDIVLLYALFNISFVISAPIIGQIGDKIGRSRIILLGYFTYLLMCLGFAYATTRWEIIVLFIIYGLFYSIDEAQSKAFITDIELEHRASAIGMYNFVTGIIYLPASILAGVLWLTSPVAVFFTAATLALLAIICFLILRPDITFN